MKIKSFATAVTFSLFVINCAFTCEVKSKPSSSKEELLERIADDASVLHEDEVVAK